MDDFLLAVKKVQPSAKREGYFLLVFWILLDLQQYLMLLGKMWELCMKLGKNLLYLLQVRFEDLKRMISLPNY